MKYLTWAVTLLITVCWFGRGDGLGDIYKYVDDQGRVHYTNNPESVPGSSRNSVVIDKEVKITDPPLTPTAENTKEAVEITPAPEDPNAPAAQLGKKQAYLDGERKTALSQQRQALDMERDALKAELDRLEEARRHANTQAEKKRLNMEIDQYNLRAKEFQKQKDVYLKDQEVFRQEVEAYEAELKKTLESTLEKKKMEAAPAQEPPPQEETP